MDMYCRYSGVILGEDVAAIVMHSMANMSIKQQQQQQC